MDTKKYNANAMTQPGHIQHFPDVAQPKPPRLNLAWWFFLLFSIVVSATSALGADGEPQPFNFDKTQANIKSLSQKLKSGPISPQQLDQVKQQAESFATAAAICIDSATGQIGRLDEEIGTLGPAVDHEPAEIVKERKNLNKQKQAIQITLSECRLVTTLATRLQNDLADQDKLVQAANFFSKEENFFGRFATTLPTVADVAVQLKDVGKRSGVKQLTPLMLLILLILAGTGAVGGLKLFPLLQNRIASYLDLPPLEKGLPALTISLATLTSGAYFLHVTQKTQPPVYGPWLLLSVGLCCLSLFLFHLRNHLELNKPATEAPVIPVLRFDFLVFLCVLLFFFTHLDLADFAALATLLELARSVTITVICLVGWSLVWSIKLPAGLVRFTQAIRAGITALSLAVICIELSGYGNFSIFLLVGLLGTLLLAYLLRFALFFIDEIIGGFSAGKHRWQQELRRKLGFSPKEKLMGITWIRLITKLLAWSIAFLCFLQFWGLSNEQQDKLGSSLVDGFSIGGLIIAPARIVLGVFIFACGWTLVSWIKMQLEKRWLKNAGLSLSAQETLTTMTGYIGFALALIIGLSVGGFSFSSLAVIAGALSVGIGFGLQNIVNNFVSGLIILFERPVKRGDWISIGSTEGYVQKISVRSTLIQTFDRSDVIVPNSELISNQVTNMMLNDNFGRLIVPVGVAYGSDTDLVRTILLDIAAANEQVVTDGSTPKPQVLFLEFGESSLNFELRCHLVNIDRRLVVKSEINYEIDREFRKHNISMPFPQRDLYIKEFPAQGRMAPGKDSAAEV
ncbi:MAG: mechanosensitive ion channel [uncultured bacterium]|nr:MAG: mechanosensitive ion channel [uncultured bacterium]